MPRRQSLLVFSPQPQSGSVGPHGPFALDPSLNVRLFSCENGSSVAAARAFVNAAPAPSDHAYGLIIEGLPDPAALPKSPSGCAVTLRPSATGSRVLAEGSSSSLKAIAQLLPPVIREQVSAAATAFFSPPAGASAPWIMGVLNVTPDSFSDGGQWLDVEAAVDRALRMAEEGASIIDIGGESSRPGAEDVPADEELRRVLPVLLRLRGQTPALLSIDTRKSDVARACLAEGAHMINDVSGLTYDPALADVVAEHPEAWLVLMHQRRKPSEETYSTEYDASGKPIYEDVAADSMRWLRTQACLAVDRGVNPGQLWIDPGFGFGKTYEQNLDLLRRIREYASVGLPILLGTSRKSSVGRLQGGGEPGDRLEGSLATLCWGVLEGAAAVRVHDVRASVRVAAAANALRPRVY